MLTHRKLVRLGLRVQLVLAQPSPTIVFERHEHELREHVPDLQLEGIAQTLTTDGADTITCAEAVRHEMLDQPDGRTHVLVETILVTVDQQETQPLALQHLGLRRLLHRVTKQPCTLLQLCNALTLLLWRVAVRCSVSLGLLCSVEHRWLLAVGR